MKLDIVRETPVVRSGRVMQLEGLFDVAPGQRSTNRWTVELPIDEGEPWQIGLVVGPSGSGKSTLAREAFADCFAESYIWPDDRAVVDGFPEELGIKDVTTALSSVGFSSPPAWLRPFRCLSNGEQFRATLARAVVDPRPRILVDEFTSVVDRTVAQIGSVAVAKAVRRVPGKQFVAVTCHDDVEAWLCPDWIVEMPAGTFARRSLRRPSIELEICRVHHSAWNTFKHHHYLTATLHKAAKCFCAFYRGRPVAFDAWLPFVGRLKDGRKAMRGSRTVCLPDFQGVGIGNALFTHIAAVWKTLGYRAFSCTAHPAEIRSRMRSDKWVMTRKPSRSPRDSSAKKDKQWKSLAASRSFHRLTASFEYVGPAVELETAKRLVGT